MSSAVRQPLEISSISLGKKRSRMKESVLKIDGNEDRFLPSI